MTKTKMTRRARWIATLELYGAAPKKSAKRTTKRVAALNRALYGVR